MEEQIAIKISLGDRLYPLKINAAEEEKVRKAAKLINEKEKQYRDQFALKDRQDALAMTALEFATEVLNATNKDSEDIEAQRLERLQRLNDYLDLNAF